MRQYYNVKYNISLSVDFRICLVFSPLEMISVLAWGEKDLRAKG